MPTYRLTVAYDGTDFHGWAPQPGTRTVAGELAPALEREPRELTVAGRTDTGVHARANVVSLAAGRLLPAVALNDRLPADVAVLSTASAADSFDARRDARARSYVYRLNTGPSRDPLRGRYELHHPRRLERAALVACAAALVGTHDFTAFTPTQTEHVRFERDILRAEWHQKPAVLGEGTVLELWIEADAFMRNMVRILVGTMLEVAGGRRRLEDLAALLEGAPRERAGDTARAHGLHLAEVRYEA